MLFTLICPDKPGHVQLRLDTRPRHLDYLKGFEANILAAGAMLSDDGQQPVGSLLIVDFPDLAAAKAFSAGDPYAQVGLFEGVTVRPFRHVYFKAPA